MNDTIEKSCWGITLWAVAIVVTVAVIVSFVVSADSRIATKTAPPLTTVVTR